MSKLYLQVNTVISKSLLILISSFGTLSVSALPDDKNQEIVTDGDYSNISLVTGLTELIGSQEQPASITQGSRIISGNKISFEIVDGELSNVTAVGSPAQFQQQPEIDSEIIYGKGLNITFDGPAQLVNIDESAELIHAGGTVSAPHIEYDIEAGSYKAIGNNTGERVNISISPGVD